MSTSMDIFLNADLLPFPDMLDIEIRSESDSLLGGHNDFSGFNFNSLELEEFTDSHEFKWFNSNSNHSIIDFYGDDGPTMVNPNAVMPLMPARARSPSPAIKESHLTFSPATIKITSIKPDAKAVKKDLLNRFDGREPVVKKPAIPITLPPAIKTKVTPILATKAFKPIAIRGQGGPTIIIQKAVPDCARTVVNTNNIKKPVVQTPKVDIDQFIYPKPAYSYSCLIAMALKNSRTGSLPVSEIYNFMCKHFPYFKTAPKAWKNSVRHNLSLNKCFEKIEKPAVNGSQRKGCLWAMNPDRINKMDEEVQKWSRKDPVSIKKAMVQPETLEALERGELKFSCSYDDEEGGEHYGDSSAAESSDSDDAQDESRVDVCSMPIQFVRINAANIETYNEVGIEEASEDLEEDKKILRAEMMLAQRELEYDDHTIHRIKRRRTDFLASDIVVVDQ